MNNNIVGLDLNIDQDYLASAVKQTVLMGISESLNAKNEIVSQIVSMVLRQKVDKNGKISSYDRDNNQTLLEYYVRKMISDVAAEELTNLVEEHRDEITKAIRAELSKKVNYDKFVNRFIEAVSNSVTNTWCPRIEIAFEQRE